MHVFVTGGSGWVGSAVVAQLIVAGHQVTGLARSDQSAEKLESAGASVLRGDLTDLDLLSAGAARSDGVIHCAFIHDFSNYAHSAQVDQRAIETLGTVLAGSGRPMIVTSGMAGLAAGRPSTERDAPDPRTLETLPRVSEMAGLAFADKGVRAMVVRLPPSVHGDGDHGFVPALINIAREKGAAAYVGAGDNVWSAVHRDDAAAVYVLAFEKGKAGSRLHAVGDQGVRFRDMAEAIGRKLDLPVVSVAQDRAGEHFGWMGGFAQFDVAASSTLTEEWLGWRPTRQGLLADLENGTYFG